MIQYFQLNTFINLFITLNLGYIVHRNSESVHTEFRKPVKKNGKFPSSRDLPFDMLCKFKGQFIDLLAHWTF